MANSVINQDTGASLEYRQLIQDEANFPIWNKAAANEFGRLAQGVGCAMKDQKKIIHLAPSNPKRQGCHLWPFCGRHPSKQI
jgi:hypothetical protein